MATSRRARVDGYLIGEKLLNFLEATEHDPGWQAEVPGFLAALKTAFLRHVEQTKEPNTVKTYRRNLASTLVFLPPRVAQLTADGIVAYREKRLAEGICPSTINGEVRVLGIMLNWAVKHKVIGSNPIHGLQQLLGHARVEMTLRLYTKVHTGNLRQAVGNLPWGSGADSPEHTISFPAKSKNGHRMVTATTTAVASG